MSSSVGDARLQQLNLEAGCIKVLGNGARERIVPVGKLFVLNMSRLTGILSPWALRYLKDDMIFKKGFARLSCGVIYAIMGRAKTSSIS